jgi:gliding motility-associated lipoprotein GldD
MEQNPNRYQSKINKNKSLIIHSKESILYFCAMLKNILLIFIVGLLFSCSKEQKPKPYGELRLEYPKAKYQAFDACQYDFEVSDFAKIANAKNPCWYYIDYPGMKAKIFITYFPIHNDLSLHIRESEKMVYEHTIKASSIDTKTFNYPDRNVYGSFYELKGQTASNIQFYITDSTQHYVTGNLYFNTRPKPDSLAPAVKYIKNDLLHLIDTFKWKH